MNKATGNLVCSERMDQTINSRCGRSGRYGENWGKKIAAPIKFPTVYTTNSPFEKF
jgi:hypothetical protein